MGVHLRICLGVKQMFSDLGKARARATFRH